MSDNSKWQFWIDRGGTFTDIVACRDDDDDVDDEDNDGYVKVDKLLSSNPEHYQDAAIEGIRRVLGLKEDECLPASRISHVKMGTTVATNALLERKGEATLLVVNQGFADILRIGYQSRPDLFSRHIVLPDNLYSMVVELPGRIDSKGKEIETFDENIAREKLKDAIDKGIKSCAIVFMHSYLNNDHELNCARVADELGFSHIAISSNSSPHIKIVFRGDTTVVDAYLSPILKHYLDQFTRPLGSQSGVYFMQSNGGLVDRQHFSGKDSLLSGPAGGAVGAAKTCLNIGFEKVIGFDMGGTSTDVSHFSGVHEMKDENVIAGVRVRTPVIDIHTVAAGGGSILSFDSQRFQVGPDSAGAYPGPACYKNNGPLTITDANVQLGRIQKNDFPKVFGKTGKESIDTEIVNTRFNDLFEKIKKQKSFKTVDEIAWGYIDIAVEKMAQAIKKITIERGFDIKDHVLSSFGGAGGQHACLIAERLGLKTVVIHPLAGVLSAVGIGLSSIKVIRSCSIGKNLTEPLLKSLGVSYKELKTQAIESVQEQLDEADNIESKVKIKETLLIHYQGSDTSLELENGSFQSINQRFHNLHNTRYGFFDKERNLVVDSLRLEATAQDDTTTKENFPNTPNFFLDQKGYDENREKQPQKVKMYSKGNWHQTPLYRRWQLKSLGKINGPAMIMDDTSTNIIEPGWVAELARDNSLILSQLEESTPSRTKLSNGDIESVVYTADPILLELFNSKFMAIAEEMGVTLRNTSHSVNIKERLDFSCALFDAQGNLIANAPHMPVHLGSMGASVEAVVNAFKGSMKPGDSYVLNNPYQGGTHLPDITVVTPLFRDSKSPLFFTASRGHHADIGGITPGSMPPNSNHIDEEGALINPMLMVRDGLFQEAEISAVLTGGKYPTRNLSQNIADLKAQVAANKSGLISLNKMIDSYGSTLVDAYMKFIRKNAEISVKRAIGKLKDGSFSLDLDNGAKICVKITVDKNEETVTVDFAGTSEEQDNNFNAPVSITRAAVLYVFRTLVDEQIPLNDGCLAPIKISIPDNSMLNPTYPRAVVAGNVETSQSIVDALYGALGIQAASQGTMNNFTFGNEKYQYYETICGGSGAGYDHPGTDAVQTHMTNSRLTDPEILESRYPVILKQFAIRKNSGGAGKYPGGCGTIREIEFREAMGASILSLRRLVNPFGLNGGEAALAGRNYVIRRSGKLEQLSGTESIEMEAGDRFFIETPGGGGFGKKT